MYKRIVGIFEEYKGEKIPDISVDSDILTDLELSSLDIIEVISKLEDAFQIEIPDKDIPGFRQVGDVVRYLNDATASEP